jgi:hypothetical protein
MAIVSRHLQSGWKSAVLRKRGWHALGALGIAFMPGQPCNAAPECDATKTACPGYGIAGTLTKTGDCVANIPATKIPIYGCPLYYNFKPVNGGDWQCVPVSGGPPVPFQPVIPPVRTGVLPFGSGGGSAPVAGQCPPGQTLMLEGGCMTLGPLLPYWQPGGPGYSALHPTPNGGPAGPPIMAPPVPGTPAGSTTGQPATPAPSSNLPWILGGAAVGMVLIYMVAK